MGCKDDPRDDKTKQNEASTGSAQVINKSM